MSSISEFFNRKSGAAVATAAAPAERAPAAPAITPGKGPSGDDRPTETWAEIGSRIGGDNEVLRNLLVDTGRQVGALDDLKDAFGKLVDPINKTLRALEQEKADNVSLRGTLADLRGATRRYAPNSMNSAAAMSRARPRSSGCATNWSWCSRARATPRASRTELSDELSTVRGRVAELGRQLSLETSTARTLGRRKAFAVRAFELCRQAYRRAGGRLSVAKERLVLLENEKRSLQNSLEQLVADNSKLTRRVNESDNALANVRTRLEQAETSLATSETERNKLTAAVDEANERRQAEANTLNMRLEAMQSRATAAEKLLADVRQSLISRTEESRLSERKVVEATIAKNATEKKLEQLLASLQGQERQIRDLDGSRANLVERSSSLQKTVKSRETALARAEERITALSDQIKKLETDGEAARVKAEKRIEELSAALQREKMDRAVSDGALEATRKNYAELQRELATERSGRREEVKLEAVPNGDKAKVSRAKVAEAKPAEAKAGDKAGDGKPDAGKVEPIIPS